MIIRISSFMHEIDLENALLIKLMHLCDPMEF